MFPLEPVFTAKPVTVTVFVGGTMTGQLNVTGTPEVPLITVLGTEIVVLVPILTNCNIPVACVAAILPLDVTVLCPVTEVALSMRACTWRSAG